MEHKDKFLEAIRSSRSLTLPAHGNVIADDFKGESPASVVTKIDKEVEDYLRDALARVDSTITFVGEEFGGNREAGRFWLCDPIDGTGHFVRGTPFSTTMVALIDNGEAVFSAIYDFALDIMYHAEKGGGAWQDDQAIHVSNRPLTDSYSILETKLHKPNNLELYYKLHAKSCMVNMVCSGYEHAMVAKGQFDARICVDGFGQDYDFAPGALLIQEAGGVVANIGSRTYDYRNTNYIATNSQIFAALTEGESAIFPITE